MFTLTLLFFENKNLNDINFEFLTRNLNMAGPITLPNSSMRYHFIDEKLGAKWKWWIGTSPCDIKCVVIFNLFGNIKDESMAYIKNLKCDKTLSKDLRHIKASLDFSDIDFLTHEKLIRLLCGSQQFPLGVSVSNYNGECNVKLMQIKDSEFMFMNLDELKEILMRKNLPRWIQHLPENMFQVYFCDFHGKKSYFDYECLSEIAEILKFLNPTSKWQLFPVIWAKLKNKNFPILDSSYCKIIKKICVKLNEINLEDVSKLQTCLGLDPRQSALHRFELHSRLHFSDVVEFSNLLLKKFEDLEKIEDPNQVSCYDEDDKIITQNSLEDLSSLFFALSTLIDIMMTYPNRSDEKEFKKFLELKDSLKWKERQLTYVMPEEKDNEYHKPKTILFDYCVNKYASPEWKEKFNTSLK